MRISDWSSDVCSSDLQCAMGGTEASSRISPNIEVGPDCYANDILADASVVLTDALENDTGRFDASDMMPPEVGSGTFWTGMIDYVRGGPDSLDGRSEEHTSELQSLMRISYAVFCLKKKKTTSTKHTQLA